MCGFCCRSGGIRTSRSFRFQPVRPPCESRPSNRSGIHFTVDNTRMLPARRKRPSSQPARPLPQIDQAAWAPAPTARPSTPGASSAATPPPPSSTGSAPPSVRACPRCGSAAKTRGRTGGTSGPASRSCCGCPSRSCLRTAGPCCGWCEGGKGETTLGTICDCVALSLYSPDN